MRRILWMSGLCLALAGCERQPVNMMARLPAPAAEQEWTVPEGLALYTLAITGMHCDGCASGLKSELARVPGVSRVEVDLQKARARVVCDTNRVTLGQILAAVEEAGFKGNTVKR